MPNRKTHAVLVAITSIALAIPACRPQPSAKFDRLLIGDVMMHSELAENLRELCMDGGRLSGSANATKAEQFVADKARAYGLANVHFEPFEMSSWRDVETHVYVFDGSPRKLEGALSLGNCITTLPGGVTAEVIDLHQGDPADFDKAGAAIAGKFVLAREGGLHRSEKMALALQHGAAGMIQVSRLEERPRVGQCHPTPRPEPGVVITGADGEALAKRLAAGETVRVNIEIKADVWKATPRNVVAEIPGHGTLADQIVILSAHLDSWHLAQGALDNGTGSAAILETARALAASGWQPRRTVRFVWFMGEELGLLGSKAYVTAHDAELENIVAVVNADMPGRPRQLASFLHPEIDDFLKSVQRELVGFGIKDEIAAASWTASDHAPFMKQGVCTVALYGDMGPGVQYYHSDGDKYDQVDIPGTVQSAAVYAVLLRRLADAPTRPSVRLDPATLTDKVKWDF